MAAELQSASNVSSTNNIVVNDAKVQGKFIFHIFVLLNICMSI
jgi:hypothetical protein